MSVCAFYPASPFYPLDICLCKNARRIEIKTTLGTAPQDIIVSMLFHRKQLSNSKFIDRNKTKLTWHSSFFSKLGALSQIPFESQRFSQRCVYVMLVANVAMKLKQTWGAAAFCDITRVFFRFHVPAGALKWFSSILNVLQHNSAPAIPSLSCDLWDIHSFTSHTGRLLWANSQWINPHLWSSSSSS